MVINKSTGFVLIGDSGTDGCAGDVIHGGLVLMSNTGGVHRGGTTVAGATTTSGNTVTPGSLDETGQPATNNV